ncbi:sulfurtransferase TusA family protein [Brevibacillus migulae]|uniref:sulfurtransferase TusA family protein n=1 Tax=Brevibacillus migulae TaxID=1644114 RepID=UPI00106E9FCD|nr:sulfurtransferase TusA family protein [Brevibacillus migulae]
MNEIIVNQTLDCKGLACPMPIVRTKKAMEAMQLGEVIEVQATDKGSLADMQGWARTAGQQLQQKLSDDIHVLDVREPAEYAFSRIPGAKSIPIGVLETRLSEMRPDDEIYVVCRSGNRSDLACQLLAEHGFSNVKNVLPGMVAWIGSTETR